MKSTVVVATLALLGCADAPTVPRTSDASTSAAATPSAAASAVEPLASGQPEPAAVFTSKDPVSLLVRGGSVIDGSGTPARKADVVVKGDRIVFVGTVDPSVQAEEIVDATGAVVTPGFIDAHAHADPLGSVEHLLAMGVTTIVVGQDGSSPAERIGAWLDKIDAGRPRVNVATMVGHATVRAQAGLGMKTSLSEKDLAKMAKLVERAMQEGAFGLSSALEYDPGSAANAEELVAVAKPVGERGGVVMSHLRSEDDDQVEASVDELLAQCERAGARAHIAHVKVVLGKGEARAKAVVDRMAAARARGMRVTADLYPYNASYTGISILFPPFAKPPNDYAKTRDARRAELLSHLRKRVTDRNGPEATLFGSGEFAGKTLSDVAKRKGVAFEQILADLGPNGASAAYFVMDDSVVDALFRDPFVMIGTDGGGGGLHPRGHGTFARTIERMVMQKKLVKLEEAVRKMSSLPADTLGLSTERGLVKAGFFADLAVFDPAKVHETATFAAPHKAPTGMTAIVVNGAVQRRGERALPPRAGRALRSRATEKR